MLYLGAQESSSESEECRAFLGFNAETERTSKMGCGTPSRRKRAVITAEEAGEIYSFKQVLLKSQYHVGSGDSVVIARMYGISPKAVRDIWNE
jgi:hypothetical protein